MRIALKSGLAMSMAALGTVLATAVPAHAVDNVYVSDACSSSDNSRCFALMYNSQAGGIWASSCFLTDENIPDLAGYFVNNGVNGEQVVYVFDSRTLGGNYVAAYCDNGSGSGQPVKNNAAAGSNGLVSSTARVYYNSGYAGPSQDFGPTDTDNLDSTLKNEDASVKIL